MTTTLTTSFSAPAPGLVAGRRRLWPAGLGATAAAAGATTALAAVAHGAGVTFADRTGAGIPLAGFAQLTVLFSLVGLALAAVLARRATHPRRTFVRTTGALLALSFVPDLVAGFGLASALTLMALHTVAAGIVVPTLASRLGARR
jgi:hypothetical protein